ncbi:MAG: hypothetical protein VX874_06755 [Pseudomonadota bacterium]|nr:hypothetical protein [Pseudomonadota bacterium]
MVISSDETFGSGTSESVLRTAAANALPACAKPCLVIGLISAVIIAVIGESFAISLVAFGFFIAQIAAFAIATTLQKRANN